MPTIQPASLPPAAPVLLSLESAGEAPEKGGFAAQFAALAGLGPQPAGDPGSPKGKPDVPAGGKPGGRMLPERQGEAELAALLDPPATPPTKEVAQIAEAANPESAVAPFAIDPVLPGGPAVQSALAPVLNVFVPAPSPGAGDPAAPSPAPPPLPSRHALAIVAVAGNEAAPVPFPEKPAAPPTDSAIRLPLAVIAAQAADPVALPEPTPTSPQPLATALQLQFPAVARIIARASAQPAKADAVPVDAAAPAVNAPDRPAPPPLVAQPVSPPTSVLSAAAGPPALPARPEPREVPAVTTDAPPRLPEAPALTLATAQLSTPAAAPATVPATLPAHDFAALIDRLVEARQAAQAGLAVQTVQTAIRHADFGLLSLSFQQDAGGLSVTVSGHDPDLARAVIAASPAAASSAGTDHGAGAPRHEGAGAQSAFAGQPQGEARQQQAQQHERRNGDWPTPARQPQHSPDKPAGQSGIFA